MDIAVWGDSITYGSCDLEALGWVGRLRKTREADTDFSAVYNRGVCGDTSEGLEKRFETELAGIVFPPDVIAFAIGMNDAATRGEERTPLVSIDKYQRVVRDLVAKAKAAAPTVLIIGITNVDETRAAPLAASATGKSFWNESIRAYNDVLKQEAEHAHVSFIDVFGILENEDLADGLHPNARGYDKMFEVLAPYFHENH